MIHIWSGSSFFNWQCLYPLKLASWLRDICWNVVFLYTWRNLRVFCHTFWISHLAILRFDNIWINNSAWLKMHFWIFLMDYIVTWLIENYLQHFLFCSSLCPQIWVFSKNNSFHLQLIWGLGWLKSRTDVSLSCCRAPASCCLPTHLCYLSLWFMLLSRWSLMMSHFLVRQPLTWLCIYNQPRL